jgi:hypothetical protein
MLAAEVRARAMPSTQHAARSTIVTLGLMALAGCADGPGGLAPSDGDGSARVGALRQRLTGTLDAGTAGVRITSPRASGGEADVVALAEGTLVVASLFGSPEVRILGLEGGAWVDQAAVQVTESGNVGQRALRAAASSHVVAVSAPFQRFLRPELDDEGAPDECASVVRIWSRHEGAWREEAVLQQGRRIILHVRMDGTGGRPRTPRGGFGG